MVVVGAGAAGLAAARRLAQRSLRVVVLEARERIGGRAWPVQLGGNLPVELGAEFVHGPAPLTRALLREAGQTANEDEGDGWIREPGGALRHDETSFEADNALLDGVQHLERDESVAAYFARFDGDPGRRAAVSAARSFVEGFDAADPEIASVRGIFEEWRSGVDSTIARPSRGYGPMFERLREDCLERGVDLRLSTPVSEILWRPGYVAAGPVEARAAVVTIPAGVLNDGGVAFAPELPAATREALQNIIMGFVVKVVLEFRTPFWERIANGAYRDAAFFRHPGGRFQAYWTQLPQRRNTITAWAGGPSAIALDGLSTQEFVEAALTGFGEVLGDSQLARREFAGAAVHDWNRDPFSRGAYSYVAVGGAGARAALAQPVAGTLFFAGEATASAGHGGTVEGALETGERAAAQAAHVLNAKP